MNDPKFSWVARKAETNVATVIAVWAALLEHASQDAERGSVGGFDPESYDCTLGLEDGTCQRVIDAMRGKGLLEIDRVAMWDARQTKPDTNTERQRRFRERRKSASEEKKEEDTEGEGNSLRNVTVTLHGAKAPAPKASKRCPEGFEPDAAFAIAECPDMDVPREIAKFKDWEFRTARKDWPAVWRRWVRQARDDGRYAKRAANGMPKVYGEVIP